VDGINPKFSRFVKGIKETISAKERKCISAKERKFTGWQESTRKDVERVFGVLKHTWQFLNWPILLHDLPCITLRATTCIILHNILMTDRVMGDPRLIYYLRVDGNNTDAGIGFGVLKHTWQFLN
jgi:hypothetical protein